MTREPDNFLPDYSTMAAPGGFRALYRLFDNQAWRPVTCKKTKSAIIYPDVISAIKAAKEFVRGKLNPQIYAATQDNEERDEDILGIDTWREAQIEFYAKARATVKNGKNRKQFVIERKTRKVVLK